MLGDNWVAQVVDMPGRVASAVYLRRELEHGLYEYLIGNNTVVTVKKGEPTEKEIVFAYLDDSQLSALVAAFDKFGVKPPEASYTQGKLEATVSHLDDMRKLVFKEKK